MEADDRVIVAGHRTAPFWNEEVAGGMAQMQPAIASAQLRAARRAAAKSLMRLVAWIVGPARRCLSRRGPAKDRAPWSDVALVSCLPRSPRFAANVGDQQATKRKVLVPRILGMPSIMGFGTTTPAKRIQAKTTLR
jgi:hypothetical protein